MFKRQWPSNVNIRDFIVRGTAYLYMTTCPDCGIQRYVSAATIGSRFNQNRTIGRCKGCVDELKKGCASPNWKGGRHVDSFGYIQLYISSNHPFALMSTKDHYIKGHRLVMAEYLGRVLTSTEHVHHKNENRQDNRIENLELLTCSTHISYHRKLERRNART